MGRAEAKVDDEQKSRCKLKCLTSVLPLAAQGGTSSFSRLLPRRILTEVMACFLRRLEVQTNEAKSKRRRASPT